MGLSNLYIPIEIERVMELEGALHPRLKGMGMLLYAHVSKPVNDKGRQVKYALIAPAPRHGTAELGEINPETREFQLFEPTVSAFYERATNRVIYQMSMPANELGRLKTVEEVLAIPNIMVKSQNTPITP